MGELIGDYEAKLAEVRQGGGVKAQERMRSKGKLLPRQRCRGGREMQGARRESCRLHARARLQHLINHIPTMYREGVTLRPV